LVKELARPFDASLLLLNVILTMTTYASPEFMLPLGNVIDDQVNWANQFLDGIVEEMEASGLKAGKTVVIGLGADDIVRVAEESKADLIALSTHGGSGLARSAMGSVAEGVVGRATVPCLIVRPPGTDERV
jgi:nucleotide-binding universal stress UspA family protein